MLFNVKAYTWLAHLHNPEELKYDVLHNMILHKRTSIHYNRLNIVHSILHDCKNRYKKVKYELQQVTYLYFLVL